MKLTGARKRKAGNKKNGKRRSQKSSNKASKKRLHKRSSASRLYEIQGEGLREWKAGREPEEKCVTEIAKQLRTIPFQPQGPYIFSLASIGRPDLSRVSQYVLNPRAGEAYPYPGEFTKVVFPSLDGTPLVGTLGLHRDGRKRPGVVLSHGLLGSKTSRYVMDAALKAFTEWDYNVFALDLRNFGDSQKLSRSPTTGGWKEGQDVLGACRYLGSMDNVTSVAAIGYSLGAGSVMNAAYQCKRNPYITGGALAWSGYASMDQMMSHISRRPPLGDPFLPAYALFASLCELRRLELRLQMKGEDISSYLGNKPFSPDYRRYIREVSAPFYGLSEEAMCNLSSPKEFISEVEIPLIVVHAEDDPVCPPAEIEDLFSAAESNDNVDIWMLPTGWHCAFRGFDEEWYWSVMRSFLDYWAVRPEDDVAIEIA